ncbi:MAG TPA: class I SAM-dependent methyltransferase [Solirubrobacteraceae bacterium]|nr:class I SAM-dependent methyltransferase [Solirubrobacteraceae bacterium]
MSGSPRISPTAHYTGFIWARNGLSHPALETTEGRVLYELVRPSMIASQAVGSGTVEGYLLARHLAIDAVLTRAVEQHGVTQVLEVAAGMSPRGWRFTQSHPELVYVEADLPEMAARKRAALQLMGSLSNRHRVLDVDVLNDGSFAAAVADLDRAGGLAIITEGLLGYLPTEAVLEVWRRFAATLAQFSAGRYISELHFNSVQTLAIRAFRVALGAFVRGRVYIHFEGETDARAALAGAGFGTVSIEPAVEIVPEAAARAGSRLVHIIEASTV